MKKYPCPWWLTIFTLLLSSCSQYAYYQTPFHTNTASYKTMPLYSDSIRNATYASATFTGGGANYNYRDGVAGGIASVYRTHTSRYLQAFYGITGMLGNYQVAPYKGKVNNKNLDTVSINNSAGGKSFGGWGATGGVSFNLPFSKNEWRVGTEITWQQEFGQFLHFRNQLPDTAANLINTRRNEISIALTSDLVFHIGNGAIGWKQAFVRSFYRLHGFDKNRVPYDVIPAYVSETLHLTIHRVTGFTQLNFGTYAMSCQLGLNYRLGRK
jgi:hypothetical protein